MYSAHGEWEQYNHLEAPEAERFVGINRATGVFSNEDGEDSLLIAWTRDEDPASNSHHTDHVLSRRPLAEMLRDAAATGYLEHTSLGIKQGPRTTRERRHG